MMTLKEIEAEFRACGSNEADAEWKQDNGDLLIRAVRQLGAVMRFYQDQAIAEVPVPDPDVLALLEE